jgi:cytochrome c-type biogenesis protein CcmE
MMNKKQRIIISAVVIVALLAYLGFASFNSNNLSYYLTVSEVVSKGDSEKAVRVNGTIVKDSTNWSPETQTLSFIISDGKNSINVVYKGNMPSNYQEDIPVVVTGIYQNKVLTASQIVLKCPSKYESTLKAER